MATSSYSMPRELHKALSRRLPRHGDKSRLVTRLIEMWLAGEIQVTQVYLRSLSVAAPNTIVNWQQP